ncbi:MAG: hypothetical protein OIN86_12715 [Candidatus Methanoperedens sp.]|nr:hypothetical protein [Candidatus Methanoperedens sp.]CAG0995198.1 hypothetical protein METP1_02524 [Methanosarcinales archaeon]
MTLKIREEHFPYWSKGSSKTVKQVDVFSRDDTNSKGFSSSTHTGTGELITYKTNGEVKETKPLNDRKPFYGNNH